jgi:hypothetical protein
MILTHNYYIDFLKSLNSFIYKRFLASEAIFASSQPIQKIEYNISSKTITTYQLYGKESYEYPNVMIDLLDIRGDNGVSSISRNAYGLISTMNTFELTYNETKKQSIFVELKRYLINFNIRINVETAADMLNYYHVISNNIPLNFTFVDYKFNYFIDISWIFNQLNWHEDNNIINFIKDSHVINIDEASAYHYYSLHETQPEFEFTSITKEEDKENMKYAVNINCIAAIFIPFILYTDSWRRIDRIIIHTDLTGYKETPILLDIDTNVFNNKNLIKSVLIPKENLIPYTKIYNEGTSFEFSAETYKIKTDLDPAFISKLNSDNYQIGLRLIQNYIDPNSERLFLPVIDFEIDKETNEIIIDPGESTDISKIKTFIEEQYNDLSMIFVHVFNKE